MTHITDEKRLGRVLTQATAKQWSGDMPKHIPGYVMLAVNSLMSTDSCFWKKDTEHLMGLLDKNPGVLRIFERANETVLAFAIRQARK